MDTTAFYTGGSNRLRSAAAHQIAPAMAEKHPLEATLCAPRTFLNARFWLWYFRDTLPMKTDWTSYPSRGCHDELVGPGGGARAAGRAAMPCLTEMDGDEIAVRQQAAELAIKAMGITFTVYHDSQDGSPAGAIDRAWPLDIIPRTIARKEWSRIEAGLKQRAAALNLFIDDVYHEQKFIRDGLMPASIISTSKNFRATVRGIEPP